MAGTAHVGHAHRAPARWQGLCYAELYEKCAVSRNTRTKGSAARREADSGAAKSVVPLPQVSRQKLSGSANSDGDSECEAFRPAEWPWLARRLDSPQK